MMKRIGRNILMAVVMMIAAAGLNAQDVRLFSTKVADVLAQMPARDLAQRDRVADEILSMGSRGIDAIAALVVPAGTGDDTNVRFALNALAFVVGDGRHEAAREMVSAAFVKALNGATDKEVKSFFLYNLKFFAGPEAVESITACLKDPVLVEPAVAALVNMKNHPAMHALKISLPESDGASRLAIVRGLGDYGAYCAEEEIRKLAGAEDPNLQKVVLYALSRIGAAESAETMVAAARKAGFAYEPTEATRSLVNFAASLAEGGESVPAKRICNMLISECKSEGNRTYALAAMKVMVDHFGYEALDLLLTASENPDKEYRDAALELALNIDDVAACRKWMGKAQEASPEVASGIINLLGRMNNPVALPVLMKMNQSGQEQVRRAALASIVAIKGKAAIPQVLANMEKAAGSELEACGNLLLPLVGPKEIPQVTYALNEVPDPAKPILIELLAARKAVSEAGTIRGYLYSADPSTAAAAYKALPSVTKAGDDVVLLTILENAPEVYVADVQRALVVAANAVENPADRTRSILSAYTSKKGLRTRLLQVIPKIGGQDALTLVSGEFNTQKGKSKDQAFAALTQWKDESPCNLLFGIAGSGPDKYRADAFAAYVTKISASKINPTQKLLMLRKAMTLASTADQKRMVIKSAGGIRLFPALVFISKYLDEPAVASDAAWAAMGIAMPPSGSKEGMYGETVKPILEKCITVISGQDSEYAKENMKTWLASMPKDPGFVAMFNGKDLTGWQGLVENPIKRAQMGAEERAAKQKAANEVAGQCWSVKDGMIVFNGKGDNLCSIKDYGDFELWVDWRITKNGDSGIYLRGTPQVQIWDTSRLDVGAQVGSGGLYNNAKNPSKPLVLADNAIGDWNTFYIKMIGERVTVNLNGILVVDNVIMENYWDRAIPIFPTGAIELQAHGTDLGFRDIYVHEIRPETIGLTVQEQTEGFVSLFNGKNLDGWIGNKTDYRADNGEILVEPTGKGGSGNLYTEKEYGDFAFRFEFQLTPGANNGIGIRTPPEGDAAYVGMEIQVLDNTAPVYANLNAYQYHGSVYGVIPARRGFLKPVGEWNEEEIWIKGTRIRVTLNGTVIVDGDIAEASRNGTMDHNEHPGLKNARGHIGFLGHGSVLRFRNIRIKEL